jgi:hypothetical protein
MIFYGLECILEIRFLQRGNDSFLHHFFSILK